MKKQDLQDLPYMLYADDDGRIFDHPYLRMAGFWGSSNGSLDSGDLVTLPEFGKLFFLPDCPPMGVDPSSGDLKTVSEINIEGLKTKCHAVAAFLEPGLVRSHLPAAEYKKKSCVLPMWAYTAVGFRHGKYLAAGFRIEYSRR